MALKGGYSKATIDANIAQLIREGKSQEQAVTIALKFGRVAWGHKHKGMPFPGHLIEVKKNPMKKRTAAQKAAAKMRAARAASVKKSKPKKKVDKRVVGTSQTKVSRATKRPPSARLKKRRSKNVTAGYYPNPTKPRKHAARKPVDHFITVIDPFMREIRYYDGVGGFTMTRNRAARFHSKAHASTLAKRVKDLQIGEFVAVFPDVMDAKEVWETVYKKFPAMLKKQAA